jgi:hypothetical protein
MWRHLANILPTVDQRRNPKETGKRARAGNIEKDGAGTPRGRVVFRSKAARLLIC